MPKENELPKPPKAKRNLPTPASPRVRMHPLFANQFFAPPDATMPRLDTELSLNDRETKPEDRLKLREQMNSVGPSRNQNGPVMRAPTTKEKIGDMIRGAYESVSEQPLARIADMLGMSDMAGVKKTFTTPDDGIRMGAMPGGPGKGMLRGLSNMERGFSSPMANRNRATSFLAGDDARVSAGKRAFENRGSRPMTYAKDMGNPLPAEAKMSHPSLPPEFQEIVASPKMPQSRTAPIDMDNLPSGKMEYLDPDVAEYMNPSGLDVTTREGQRRLRFLTGK